MNPTSVPFFPAGNGFLDEDFSTLDFSGKRPAHEPDVLSSLSSFSLSSTVDFQSVKSSPSPAPTRDAAQDPLSPRTQSRQSQRTPSAGDDPRSAAALRQTADRTYPIAEARSLREVKLSGSYESLLDNDANATNGDSPRAKPVNDYRRNSFLGGFVNRSRDRLGGTAVNTMRSYSFSHPTIPEDGRESPASGHTTEESFKSVNSTDVARDAFNGSSNNMRSRERIEVPSGVPAPASRSVSFNSGPYMSASPVSSADSASQTASSVELAGSFDAQLQASPMIHDILDRLVRCEYSTREIQRDLGEVNRKISLLLERTIPSSSAPPEFQDPFSSSGASGNLGPRQSFGGNVAPNQAAPSSDMSAINQRLNTLTSSVGQLLAMQTQNMQTANATFAPGANGMVANDVPPNQVAPNSNMGMTGRGINSRASSAITPTMSMRSWSQANVDAPSRLPSEGGPPASGMARSNPLLHDRQRRSVMGLVRRDMSGVSSGQQQPPHQPPQMQQVTPPTDTWPVAPPRADGGPTLTKWEQLSLSPELLRSLNKFGVGPPNKIQQRALPFLLRGADIIAQAPPTQERIAAYVIPAIQIVLTAINARPVLTGPVVVMVSTTVDQATQAQRMISNLGGPIGVRSALGVGTVGDVTRELRLLQQNNPHIICGTPQKLHALFNNPVGLLGSDVRFLVLDEVDQLIARNLHEFVFGVVKLFPSSRARSGITGSPGGSGSSPESATTSPFSTTGRKMSTFASPSDENSFDRQTALFSNTVPQDVLNLASAIQLRDPVRVLVRRDGNVAQSESNGGQGAARLPRQYYLYLAFTASPRSESAAASAGLGIIGSGRGVNSAETVQAREWKLDALADIFDDIEISHAIVHVGGVAALETVTYKLASKGLDTIPIHGEMNPTAKMAAITKYRSPTSPLMKAATRVLVVYDVQIKATEVPQVPVIINYDLPKAVEEYGHRVAPASASNYSRPGVVVNFVTAAGGDVEMLRSIECFYKIKCPEVPVSLRDII